MSNESYCYWMRNNPSEKVNAEYVAEIEKYKKNPGYACEKEKSLKLLKKFEKKDFQTFWQEPVCDYFPAITEGTMKIAEKVYTHDEAIEYAKNIINGLNPKELARAFLYGVSHNLPEYRTALAFGVICGHTKVSDMLDALSTRSYFAHPVNRWTRKCGIDYDMIDYLFGDLY